MGDIVETRKTQYPQQPWLWRPDWADGRVRPLHPAGAGTVAGYWIVAVLALAAAPSIALALPATEPLWPARAVLWGLALLLGACGVLAILIALRRSRALNAFGDLWLELDTNPGVAGEKLRSVLRAARSLPDQAPVSLRLVCTMRASTKIYVSGYSMNAWEHAKETTVSGGVVPIEFDLPADMPESDPDIPDRPQRCTWDLLVTVTAAEATCSGHFQVPVFKRESLANR